jgi:ABC-type transport system involved in multi-copper enzyme maturation permease subunit
MYLLTEALGGPVLAWELRRATRRRLWRYLWIGYCAWLVLTALILFGVMQSQSYRFSTDYKLSALELYRTTFAYHVEVLNDYSTFLLEFQLGLVVVMVPALTASCLGQEKERGTLFALFGTQLTSRQILGGKLLGRLVPIIPLILATVPVLVFVTTWTGRGLTPLFLALAQEVVIAFALGAACLLFGIWIRRAVDATMASYLFLGLAYVVIRWFTESLAGAFWFDPLMNLATLLAGGSPWVFVFHLTVWYFMGLLGLRLGWGRLRKVCVEQRDKRPPRRLWAFRPPIGANPFRWRECYVIGLAPMPILRVVPRWVAVLGVFTFSAAVTCIIANSIARGFLTKVFELRFADAFRLLWGRKQDISDYVSLMGVIFIVLANILVGVRCGTSVAEERRRNTWDDLLLTAQSFREITNGKMWGVLQATLPYIVAYALPVFFLASVGGPGTLLLAAMWIILPCTIVYIAARSGIDMLRVPADMDETRQGGAFWFEKETAERRGWGP